MPAASREAVRARRTRAAHRATLVVPVLGAAAGAWLLARGEHSRPAGLLALGASLGLGLARWQLQRLVTEQSPYEVVARLGDIELRSYPPQVWAETLVQNSSWTGALHEGFQRLAGYLFGNNSGPRPASPPGAAAQRGEKLSMTAPVLAEVGDSEELRDRSVAFVMPADRELSELPEPADERVHLRQLPERLVAALPFRGNYESDLPSRKRDELLLRLRDADFLTRGEVRFAGYDPPTTWTPLRRNEVLIDLAEI